MSHSVPLKYEFLKLHNMCPEALQIGEQCVIHQLSILLKEPAEMLSREFDTIFESYASHPPFNGTGWRDVGISTEMVCDFAEKRGINLHIFHGKYKIDRLFGGSGTIIVTLQGPHKDTTRLPLPRPLPDCRLSG